jgi:hypothetical protein
MDHYSYVNHNYVYIICVCEKKMLIMGSEALITFPFNYLYCFPVEHGLKMQVDQVRNP